MQLHSIKRNHPNKKSVSVGRGGKRGKTSGRGTKGQKARAGRKIRPEIRDVIKRVPKLRGYHFKGFQEAFVPVNVSALEAVFSNGDIVTPRLLVEKGVVVRTKGKVPRIKVLSEGELSKKITVKGCAVSEDAKNKIEKAGGKVLV